MTKKILCIVLLLTMILSFAACGKNSEEAVDFSSEGTTTTASGNTVPHEGTEIEYYAEAIFLPEEIGTASSFCIFNNCFYVIGDGSEEQALICRDLDGGEWSELELLPAEFAFDALTAGQDSMFVLAHDENGKSYFCRTDGYTMTEMSALSMPADALIRGFYAYEGGLLIWTDTLISICDSETGDVIKSREIGNSYRINAVSVDGNVLYAQLSNQNGHSFVTVDDLFSAGNKNGASLEKAAFTPLCISDYDGNGQLLGMSEGLVRYDSKEESYELVASWTDLKCAEASLIQCILEWQNGDIFFLDRYEGKLIHASPREVQKKTVLTLATARIDGPLYTVIQHFNESSPYYKVETRLYEFGSWDRLRVEIMSGHGPDMIDTVSLALGGEQALYLENLLPFIESDPELSESDFIPAVLDAIKENGKLYSLTPTFTLSAVIDYDGASQTGLSFEEYGQSIGLAPDVDDFYPIPSAIENFREAFPVIENDVVTKANGTYSVDTELLKNWLQFCKNAPGMGVRHEQLTNYERIPAIRTYISKDAELIGWPAQKSTGFYITPGGGYFNFNTAILSSSENKEAAWSFLRCFLLDYYEISFGRDTQSGLSEFSVLANRFDEHLQKAVNSENINFTAQDAQRLKEIVYGIDVPNTYNEGLKDVLIPLVEAYFSGQRSLDDTVVQMESKIKLFLSERD